MIRQQIHAAVPLGARTKHLEIIPRKNASIRLSADLIAEGYYLPQTLHALARTLMHPCVELSKISSIPMRR